MFKCWTACSNVEPDVVVLVVLVTGVKQSQLLVLKLRLEFDNIELQKHVQMLNRMFIPFILNMRFSIWKFLLTGWHANTFEKISFMVPLLLPMQIMHLLMILPLQALQVESKMLRTCCFEYKICVFLGKKPDFLHVHGSFFDKSVCTRSRVMIYTLWAENFHQFQTKYSIKCNSN